MSVLANVSNSSGASGLETATDGTYVDIETMYVAFGSTWFWDSFWLFFTTPLSVYGTLSNLLSAYIFSRGKFQEGRLYSFLRVFAINSSVLCLFTICDFAFYSRRYVWFVNTYWANFYDAKIHENISNTAYFYCSVLDICITLDRLATFSKTFRIIPDWLPSWKLMLGLLVSCVVLNIPYYLVQVPVVYYFYINDTQQVFEMHSTDQSEFAMSLAGRILGFGLYFIRDFLTMLVSIVLNVLSIIYLKRYLAKRSELLKVHNVEASVQHTKSSDPNSPTDASHHRSHALGKKARSGKVKVDRKASVMVIVMCGLEVIEHMVILVAILYSNFDDAGLTETLDRLADFVVIAKNAANFPIFFAFNKIFKDYVVEHFNPFRRPRVMARP